MRTLYRDRLAAALFVLASAVLSTAALGRAHALDRVRLQLRWQHQFQFAGYYVALDRGYYAEQGLDVELVEGRAGLEPVAEVVAGRAEYGVGTSALLLSRAAGQPVVALAPVYQHSPLVLVSLRSSGIDSVHDLVGRRVAMEPEAADLLAYLRSESVAPNALKLVSHAQDVSALLDHSVDATSAYVTDEPYDVARAGEEAREFSPRAGGIDFYGDTLFTTDTEVAAHRDRVRAFVAASLRGWREAMRDPERAIDLVLARTQRHSREHLRFEARRSVPLIAADIVEVGYANPGRWQHIAGVYASLGLVPNDLSLDGFLYRPSVPAQPPTWLLVSLAGSLALAGLIFAGWVRAFRLARTLERERTRWKALLEASPQPTLILAEGFEVQYQNPRADALLHAHGPALTAMFAHGSVKGRLDAARAGEPVHDLDVSVSTPDAERWFSLSAAACPGAGKGALLVCLADVSGRKAVEASLRREAETDALTGVANRRYTVSALDQACAHAVATGAPLSLGVFDVDRFKSINDTQGHALGDRVLCALADAIRGELRREDVLGRLGGDEFVFILPGIDLSSAGCVAERLRSRAAEALRVLDGVEVGATISIGLATLAHGESADALIARADAVLYRAKAEGRNRVGDTRLPAPLGAVLDVP